MKKNITVLLLIFLMIRIVYTFFFHSDEVIGDGGSYNSYALAILKSSDWIVNPSFWGDSREPVYPLFIAMIYLLFGSENLFAVYFFQIVTSIITLYYIYKLSFETIGYKKSLLSVIWGGGYIFYLRYNGFLLRETLVFFLVILVFYYFWKSIKYDNRITLFKSKNHWIYIVCFILLIHTDARYIFYIPFFSIILIFYYGRYIGLLRFIKMFIIIILLMVPWTIRNFIAYDTFVLINTRTFDLSKSEMGYTTAAKKKIPMRSIEMLNPPTESPLNKKYPSESERRLIKQGINPNWKSTEEIDVIKNDIYPDSTFLSSRIYWLKEFWRPARFKADYFPFPDARFQSVWSVRHNVAGLLCYGSLIPFAIIGLIILIKENNRVWLFLSFPIVVQTLLHVLQWSRNRYRIPIDAFIIIIAVYGMYWCYEKLKSLNVLKI